MKAAVTEVAGTGWFSAIAAGWNTDRVNERLRKGAFRDTIRRWKRANRPVPSVWDHGRDARDIIGSVDASTMQERGAGFVLEAVGDLEDSELARGGRAHRRRRVKELTRLDLMEITLTSVPANPAARVIGWKSAAADCPPHLIGTAWDPTAATGEGVTVLQKSWRGISRHQLPVQVMRFPVK
jgi:hypothetical protein